MALCNGPELQTCGGAEMDVEGEAGSDRLWLTDCAAAEAAEMHEGTKQTQTCHFRSLIQSVMIFPHLTSLSSPLSYTPPPQCFFKSASVRRRGEAWRARAAPQTTKQDAPKRWLKKTVFMIFSFCASNRVFNYTRHQICFIKVLTTLKSREWWPIALLFSNIKSKHL